VFLDGTFLSIRRGKTAKEPVYLALGLKPNGRREILGFVFSAEGERARNWEEVLKDLWRRGVRRVRIFVTDNLPGLEEALRKIFPEADCELHVLHSVRDALNQAWKKDREALAEDLRVVYRAETEEEAKETLKRLRERWGTYVPRIGACWKAKACASYVSSGSPADPPVPRYHEPSGADELGGAAANEGGGFSRGGSARETLVLGAQ